ncbi:unnamed protein product [Prunus brigantina]
MKCGIPMEEKHFIRMAQAALKISLRKRFDGILFGDAAGRQIKHPNMRNRLRKNNEKRNSSKGTYYKSPIHPVRIESKKKREYSEEGEVAVAEMAKLKHPISRKALTKPPKDRSRHLSRGGLFQTNQYRTSREELKGEAVLQMAQLLEPFYQQCVVFGDVIREGITAGKVEASGEISCSNNRSLSSTTSQHGGSKQTKSAYAKCL